MMILKSAADTLRFTTQNVTQMATGPLIRIYKAHISPFTRHYQLKVTVYPYLLYVKVTTLLGNELSQVFTSGDFIFVAPMNSKTDGRIGVMDLCDDNGIPVKLIYDNDKEE